MNETICSSEMLIFILSYFSFFFKIRVGESIWVGTIMSMSNSCREIGVPALTVGGFKNCIVFCSRRYMSVIIMHRNW